MIRLLAEHEQCSSNQCIKSQHCKDLVNKPHNCLNQLTNNSLQFADQDCEEKKFMKLLKENEKHLGKK